MNKIVAPLLVLCLISSAAAAPVDWGPWKFLLGEWEASGGGQPGDSQGVMSFQTDLQGTAIVRRNRNQTGGHVHEDLMIVRPGDKPGRYAADYYDNEGHAIRYNCETQGDGVVCTSSGPGPRFRLTYRPDGPARAFSRFEVAPPDGDFKTYLEGTLTRKKQP